MPTLPKNNPRRAWQPERKPFGRRKSKGRPYNSKKWRRASHRFLAAHPLCASCQEQGRTTAATVTDHIDHDRYDFWDEAGWQPMCAKCHNIKSGKEAHK